MSGNENVNSLNLHVILLGYEGFTLVGWSKGGLLIVILRNRIKTIKRELSLMY